MFEDSLVKAKPSRISIDIFLVLKRRIDRAQHEACIPIIRESKHNPVGVNEGKNRGRATMDVLCRE
jgi:hypothetical protein